MTNVRQVYRHSAAAPTDKCRQRDCKDAAKAAAHPSLIAHSKIPCAPAGRVVRGLLPSEMWSHTTTCALARCPATQQFAQEAEPRWLWNSISDAVDLNISRLRIPLLKGSYSVLPALCSQIKLDFIQVFNRRLPCRTTLGCKKQKGSFCTQVRFILVSASSAVVQRCLLEVERTCIFSLQRIV